ncbi:hypothetical protein HZP46_05735 [Elizabethkingia anophelis]|nr:hypothetical protein [Elizabethkingia anophelis]
MAEQKDSIGVKRAKLDSLKIYEITEKELDTLEKGSGDSLFLNFAISLFSIFISFLIVLLTVDFFYDDKDDLVIKFIIFICLTIITLLGSIICFIAWYRNKGDFKTTLQEIKNRMNIEVIENNDEESIEIKE